MQAQIEASAGGAEEPVPDTFIVMEENWPALQMFFRCATQWRQSIGGVTGLDYTAVISVINLTTPKKQRKQLFDDVCLIEQGALQALSRKRERHGKTV